MYFSVHKCISQCTNIFLSAQMYFSVHKFISQCTNIFLSAQMYFSVHKYIFQCTNLITAGSLFILDTFSHMTLRLNPSIHPCMGKPYVFSLSYPSVCHAKFGPGFLYSRRFKRCVFLSWQPVRSSSRQSSSTTLHGT